MRLKLPLRYKLPKLDYGKKSKFKLKIGYHGLKENATNIDASLLESIPGIFPAEYFWASLSFVGVSDMVLHVISILRAGYWITDCRCTPSRCSKVESYEPKKRFFIHTFTIF